MLSKDQMMKGDNDHKKYCPNCGKPMKLAETKKDKDETGNAFPRWKIWNCLNCNENWEVDLMKNMLQISIHKDE